MKTYKKRRLRRKSRKQKGGDNNTLVYYLNLDERKDRDKNIKDAFKNMSIIFERIPAVKDGNPWKGCGLSFKKAIEKAKVNKLPYVFIMEDDCIPTEYFKDNWPKIKNWLESNLNNWDAFSGGNTYYFFYPNETETISKITNIDNIRLYSTKSQAYNCMCFNSRIYDKMLEWNESDGPIDLWLNKNNIKTVTCIPFIGVQNKGESNIEKRFTDYNEYYKASEDIIKSINQNGGEMTLKAELLGTASPAPLARTEGYVINLDKRKDRREQIQKDFSNSTSIKLTRFSAIEDKNGHNGVGRSIQELVRMAKEKNLESILIMEDDCKPLKHFEKRWGIVKKWLDNNKDKWNIFNGGVITPIESKLIEVIDDKNKIYTSNGGSALQFVIYKKESYDTVLNWSYEKDSIIDWYINRMKNKYVYIDPPLALQHNGVSNTNNKMKNFTNKSVNQGNYSLNKIKEVENLYNKKVLINYADKGYVNSRKQLKESALNIGGLDEVIEYNSNDIDEEFKKKNKRHFENTRGAGLWLWKPYLILKKLLELDDNDILVYCDAGATFTDSILPYIEKMKDSIMLFYAPYEYWSSNKYTKMDIFKKLNCMDNKNVTHGTQIEGGFMILKKSNSSIEFIKKWLELCEDYHLLSDEPSVESNLPEFVENRHDQSILSALGKLYKDKYNIDIEKKPFINHHRRQDGGSKKFNMDKIRFDKILLL